ncbi:MAG: hypothetical protein ACYTEQ_22540, partial [Planctomycetota bacterium]
MLRACKQFPDEELDEPLIIHYDEMKHLYEIVEYAMNSYDKGEDINPHLMELSQQIYLIINAADIFD